MADIRVLKKSVAEKIAAGEVVERPASVVKELLENSVDAKATSVEIELKNNGIASIRITDDGTGIPPGEIKTAFLRHATSKVREAADLDNIGTLGFRGEALAAISAVSKVRMISKTSSESFATEYRIAGGEEESFGTAAGDTGTTVFVDEIFFNTPARMKFLKKDVGEGNAVQSVVEQIALSHPETAFRLIRDGRTSLSTPGNGELYAAVYAVLPKEIAKDMFEINVSEGGIRVFGYCSRPEVSRKSRSFQYTFVNGRYVKSSTVTAAAERAYKDLNMTGKYPAFVMNLQLPLDCVDVNVHPAKTEVRFQNDGAVFHAVYHAVRAAVTGYAMGFPRETEPEERLPEQSFATLKRENEAFKEDIPPRQTFLSMTFDSDDGDKAPELLSRNREAVYDVKPNAITESLEVHKSPVDIEISPRSAEEIYFHESAPAGKEFTVIGELLSTYILCEYREELLVIDKHAAHERILFENFRREELHAHRQILLQPELVTVSAAEKQALTDAVKQLEQIGFVVEEFGEREVAVREVPTYFPGKSVADAVTELAGQLLLHYEDIETEETTWLLHSVACRAAIKAGHRTTEAEMASLAGGLLSGRIPAYCPHGRPVYFTIPKKEIEKRFGRIR